MATLVNYTCKSFIKLTSAFSKTDLPTIKQESIGNFSQCSGLNVNEEKTEFFGLGLSKLGYKWFTHKFKTCIKILGVHFDCNNETREKANFDSIMKPMTEVLNLWRWRGLTLISRIQIVKSFVIPKIMSKVALIPVLSELI